LARSRTPEELREALKTCLSASTRMTELVEGLLTLARADAGKLELVYKPIDFRRLVRETIALLHPLAEIKRVSLEEKLASAHVSGDASRLAQVITNLVSNAIHYNRPGGLVTVRLGVNGDWVELRVEDTGCGIPDADRPHVFERFYRVDKARSRASGGHGLGLAISKSIVEAHGGTISFESRWQEGTIFIVRLTENDQKDERD
jgi:signal transduction histidine kinase